MLFFIAYYRHQAGIYSAVSDYVRRALRSPVATRLRPRDTTVLLRPPCQRLTVSSDPSYCYYATGRKFRQSGLYPATDDIPLTSIQEADAGIPWLRYNKKKGIGLTHPLPQGAYNSFLSAGQAGFGLIGDLCECVFIHHRQLRQQLSVNIYFRLVQSVDQTAVG